MIPIKILKKAKEGASGSGNSGSGSSVNFTPLYNLINKKLDAEIFDDLFEKVNVGSEDNPVYAIRAKYGLFSNEFISVRGVSDSESAGGSGVSLLSELEDVAISGLTEGQALVWNGYRWTNRTIETGSGGLDEAALANYLTSNGYLTKSNAVSLYSNQISGNIYDVPCGKVFSGYNIADAPTTGWVSGLVLGSNFNSNHFQHYLVEAQNGRWYSSRSYSNGLMTSWQTFAFLSDLTGYATSASLSNYVLKSGDTMTGALTLPRLNVLGSASSTAYITADTVDNAYLAIGDRILMVWTNAEAAVRPGRSYNNIFSLGTSEARWSNLYATTINVSSNSLVSNLNADLLDGYHSTSFFISTIGVTSSTDISSIPGNRSGSYNIPTSGWSGSAFVLYCAGSNSGLCFYRPGGSNSVPQLLIALDSTSNWANQGTIMTSYRAYIDGNNPLYFSAYGGGFYMLDSSWIRTYNSKGIYTGSGSVYTEGNIYAIGNVGIGTTSPSYKLHVAGVAYASTGVFSDGYVSAKGQNTSSDARLKTEIHPLLLRTEQIASAPLASFIWRDSGKQDFGSIAQYWQDVCPLFVSQDPKGFLSLPYGKIALAASIVNSREILQILAREDKRDIEIRKLKERIKKLESRLAM